MSSETELPRVKPDHKTQPVAGIKPNRSVQWDDRPRYDRSDEETERNFRKSLQAALQCLMRRPELSDFGFQVIEGESGEWLLEIRDEQGIEIMSLSAEEVIRLSRVPAEEGVLVQFDC